MKMITCDECGEDFDPSETNGLCPDCGNDTNDDDEDEAD